MLYSSMFSILSNLDLDRKNPSQDVGLSKGGFKLGGFSFPLPPNEFDYIAYSKVQDMYKIISLNPNSVTFSNIEPKFQNFGYICVFLCGVIAQMDETIPAKHRKAIYKLSSLIDKFRNAPVHEKKIYDILIDNKDLFDLDISFIRNTIIIKEGDLLFRLGRTTGVKGYRGGVFDPMIDIFNLSDFLMPKAEQLIRNDIKEVIMSN